MFSLFLKYIHNHRGQSVVEFALVIPVFLLIFGGIVDFGRIFNQLITVNQAAGAAARIVAVTTSSVSAAAAISQATAAAKSYGSGITVIFSDNAPVSKEFVTTTVTCPVTIITPLISALVTPNPYPVTGTATIMVE